jgi:hypothetical protein
MNRGLAKNGQISGLIVRGMSILGACVVPLIVLLQSTTSSTAILNGHEEPTPRITRGIGENDMIFFLHYVNATETAKSLPGGGSTLTYFDTTLDWNDVNVTYNVTVAEVNFDWDLSPPLAGDFTVSAVAFKIWSRFVSGAAPTGLVEVTAIELNSTGIESWSETFYTDSVTFPGTPELKIFNGVLSSPHTFEAGSSIKIRFRFNPGSGKTFEFYYDTAQMNSRVEFSSEDSMKISNVVTLDYQDVPKVGFDPTASNKTIKIRATLTDPFGGYDIKSVNATLTGPPGLIIDNVCMTKTSGTSLSYYNDYELQYECVHYRRHTDNCSNCGHRCPSLSVIKTETW